LEALLEPAADMGLISTKVLLAIVIAVYPSIVRAQDPAEGDVPPRLHQRPTILPDRRWEEDWSMLADPRVEQEPLDRLKYMPFSTHHPSTYLSVGLNLRERFETDHAPLFGTRPGLAGGWLLSRLEAHADLRLGRHVQLFTQLQSAFAPGKDVLTPIDQDRLDVEQAFIGLKETLGGGTLTLRLGRQLLPIDLQRFHSVRDKPNLHQSYDAALADFARGAWRFTGAYTHPVQTRDLRPFDDYSDKRVTFGGILIRRHVLGSAQLSVDFTRYTHANAMFTTASGDERRDAVDVRFNGATNGFDWDIEAMNQIGQIGSLAIEAKAVGSLAGYTFDGVGWSPRLGLGVDFGTGDHDPHDSRLETFNPLFPNGYYLTDYTGYPNLLHARPTVTVHPTHTASLTLALARQWRETTADAVYVFPNVPLPGTAGAPGRYTGTYCELRGDWTITPHYSVAFDAVHLVVGNSIRAAGGHDSNYLGVELRYGL
jgi:alginate export protein